MHPTARDLIALVLGAALALAAVELVPTARAVPNYDQRAAEALESLVKVEAEQVRVLDRVADAGRDQASELGRLVRATERCGGR